MNQPVKIGKGAFADVWDLHNGTVLKAFRSESRAPGEVIDIRDHDLLTNVFCAQEINAYLKLKEIENVNDFIPAFHGRKEPIGFLPDSEGPYVKGAAFIIEKINGSDQKVANLPQRSKESVEPILWLLSDSLNDLNVWDSSCFFESFSKFKIIDFALWDASDYECYMFAHGRLNEEQKHTLQRLADN